ncbi:hypothetical protein Celaphus_00007544 [Cervus elaphus hippelaphus]|uniref:Uncharacterized protein n=1 Tax=Cervus elaphus hippelaphus TaxID=46360 RepID=A0A212CB04_CEREH|nr:hypothetical protein Celaphus_00007544 [Cervus elaphus hippelaphus]
MPITQEPVYASTYSPALPAAHKYLSFVSINQVRKSLRVLSLIAISERQGETYFIWESNSFAAFVCVCVCVCKCTYFIYLGSVTRRA